MKLNLLGATLIGLAMLGGASVAQDASLFTDKTMMGPFFSDDTMGSLRTDEELKAEFQKMSPENQEKLIAECKKSDSREQVYSDLCDKISAQ